MKIVTLGTSGVEVAPIADGRMDTADHHVFLDVDVTPRLVTLKVVEPETGLVPALQVPIVLIAIVVVAALSLAIPGWLDDKEKYQSVYKRRQRIRRHQRK